MQHPPVSFAAGKGCGGVQTADSGNANKAWTVPHLTAASMRTAIVGPCWMSMATVALHGYGVNHWQRRGHMAGRALVPDAMVRCVRPRTVGHHHHWDCHLLVFSRCSLVEVAVAVNIAAQLALQAPRLFAGVNGAVLLASTMAVHNHRHWRMQTVIDSFWAAACGLTSGPILMAERMHCLANDSRRLSSRVKSRLSFGQTA